MCSVACADRIGLCSRKAMMCAPNQRNVDASRWELWPSMVSLTEAGLIPFPPT